MQLRYDPEKPPHFSLLLNIVFGLASTFRKWSLFDFRRFSRGVNIGPSGRQSLLLSAFTQYVPIFMIISGPCTHPSRSPTFRVVRCFI